MQSSFEKRGGKLSHFREVQRYERVMFELVVGLSNVVERRGCQGSTACVDQLVGKRDARHESRNERRAARVVKK